MDSRLTDESRFRRFHDRTVREKKELLKGLTNKYALVGPSFDFR